MTLTHFMIIGAQKCGTTSLAAQLAQHPGVCFCRVKEPHFFSRRPDWRQRLARYDRLFPACGGRLRGEASTSYSFVDEYPQTPARLARYNPDLRLIYIMRSPLDRIVSQLRHDLLSGWIKPQGLEQRVLEDDRYIGRTRYGRHLETYLEWFDRSQILPLLLEEIAVDPRGQFERVERFLNLPPVDPGAIDLQPHNRAQDGQLRRLPARERLRWFAGSLPAPAGRALRWFVDGPARPLLYRRRLPAFELSDAMQSALWSELEPEVRWVEQFLQRDLSALWQARRPTAPAVPDIAPLATGPAPA